MKSDRHELFEQLRKKYPQFVYESFSYSLIDSEIQIVFEFRLGEEYIFRPEIKLPFPDNLGQDILSDSLIRNIIFNMGMIELISYWKAACPPRVIIKPMALTPEQIKWWKKLYLNGLGEFIYQNGIKPGKDFIEITAGGSDYMQKSQFRGSGEVLVPVGGGKDSVVTLELLSGIRKCRPFIINPREASIKSSFIAGFRDEEIISISRTIDPLLLELNDKGFLNGHTPFSAMLAFTSMLVAAIYGMDEIALSNESSANEPNIPGTNINHQYSKSIEFEEDFREYVSLYITEGIDYFSFLRPLNELQISGLFSKYPQHYKSFRSCNVGSKTDSWCGKCPKCLFTFIMLGVFLEKKQVVDIFGDDLFGHEDMIPVLEQLCGIYEKKPFECVGTIKEVNVALKRIIRNSQQEKLPLLLRHYRDIADQAETSPDEFMVLMREFSEHHIPGRDQVNKLKEKLDAF